MMGANRSGSPAFKEKKSVSIAALIVCFVVACAIWLYAQATDDEINVKTYNQLPVEIVGADVFLEQNGYDVHSLAVQIANISISATNRELVKYDAQSIRLVADVGAANNGVAMIKAFYVDTEGNSTEIKNYEVTPAVVTVNVSKQVSYTVVDITTDRNENDFIYKLDQTVMSGTITLFGPIQDLASIEHVGFSLDYKNVMDKVGTHTVPVSAIAFYDAESNLLYGETNKNEAIKYDTTGIMVSVTVENIYTDGK